MISRLHASVAKPINHNPRLSPAALTSKILGSAAAASAGGVILAD